MLTTSALIKVYDPDLTGKGRDVPAVAIKTKKKDPAAPVRAPRPDQKSHLLEEAKPQKLINKEEKEPKIVLKKSAVNHSQDITEEGDDKFRQQAIADLDSWMLELNHGKQDWEDEFGSESAANWHPMVKGAIMKSTSKVQLKTAQRILATARKTASKIKMASYKLDHGLRVLDDPTVKGSRVYFAFEEAENLSLPIKLALCDNCEGHGTHLNESMRNHAYSQEDYSEDPEFFEDMRSGTYDQSCNACNGQGRIYKLSENEMSADEKSLYAEIMSSSRAWAEMDEEDAYTRRMENGGYEY